MKFRFGTTLAILTTAALALWSAATLAGMENLENAYEAAVAHVVLPSSGGGQVVIRECTGCKPVVMRVNRDTIYKVGSAGPAVSLAELQSAAQGDGASTRLMTVFYSLESGVVTRIVLSAG